MLHKSQLAERATAAAAAALAAAKIEKVSGRVILDANANGRLDPDEKGMPGVPVTDGVNWDGRT